ncbi:hypothetical protein CW751_02940 [Brumimicrobium salinarum]|uniref:Outer membrane protein beta-barrel domain-containing protein n=1 Tax=Brumimicrobium salinarum TaxID=2058658 RepID=A0A2I0R6V9_9FLAO|nr:hypothetical protein [Brumimicrobium salinarum]PKR82304.1 hypothetical protein CW751_02940 [Brumimicrobium salinarum]
MRTTIFILIFLPIHFLFAQNSIPLESKHQNNFGLSFDLGGGMEKANDINTTMNFESIGGYANPIGKPNLGLNIFWDHQWSFYKKHGLTFGLGVSFTTFSYDVAFKNIEFDENKTREHILGNGFRSSFFSLDLPLYYTYTFKTKHGNINPIIGINIRELSYMFNSGRNSGGVSGSSSELSGNDTIYYNNYNFKFGTQSMEPILMPSIGVKYSKIMSNDDIITFHLTGKLHLNTSNSPEVYLNDFDNTENGIKYNYYIVENENGASMNNSSNSIYYRINMSSINLGISYSFK